ncbi:MAG TPA: sugar ABC transporter permease, partial [Clostridiaceae bacterium]|nr:sugar ABC transporter permease [Clostridiaceae bacterium]
LNNLWFLLIVPVQMLLALVLSVLMDEKVIGKAFIKTAFFLPYVSSFVAVALIWFQLLNPSEGPVNNILKSIGIANPPKWFGSSHWVKPSIAMMMTWKNLGYNIILYTAGLQGIPNTLYESADVDGASAIRKFFSITVPMISPVSFFILILSVINTFLMWSNIQILTQGGPGSSSTVIGYYIYKVAFSNSKMGYASAISWVLFSIILVFTLLQWRGQKKWVNYL